VPIGIWSSRWRSGCARWDLDCEEEMAGEEAEEEEEKNSIKIYTLTWQMGNKYIYIIMNFLFIFHMTWGISSLLPTPHLPILPSSPPLNLPSPDPRRGGGYISRKSDIYIYLYFVYLIYIYKYTNI